MYLENKTTINKRIFYFKNNCMGELVKLRMKLNNLIIPFITSLILPYSFTLFLFL